MSELPTGTVTFLFTDVEGSTRLLQKLGPGYRAIQDAHQAVLRTAIAEERGVEVRTEGDSFFVVFPTPAAAVRAAVAAQRGLAAHPWPEGAEIRVRMGMHTGEGVLGGDDYVGIDVNRAARIAAAGHGGQVLISEATRGLVEPSLPEGVGLRDLGEHRLKDLPRPEHLHQLVIGGLPADFPELKSLDARPNNLPLQLTSFVGREEEVDHVLRLLGDSRLVTLTGPGGAGKTRLALEVGARALEANRDGAFFADMSSITDPALVPSAIAQAIGIREEPSRPALTSVKEHLRDRELLLILDNFEQVIDGAGTVEEVLDGAPAIRVLVTSRALLGIYGEQTFLIPALSLPDPDRLPGLEQLSQYEAVRLFIERARGARPDFRVTNENAPAVAEICARLDGLPLAIELAASRVRILPPIEILTRLQRNLSVLAGERGRPERQRTLHGAIAWSYDLLEEPERNLFARMSVFSGGANLDALEAVGNPGGDLSVDTLDCLASLVDKSLVRQSETPDGEARFGMLETIREFAAEKLRSEFDLQETELRHAEHFASLAAEVGELVESDPSGAVRRVAADLDNVRAVLAWAGRTGHSDIAFRTGEGVWRVWLDEGRVEEGRHAIEELLSGTAETPQGFARGLLTAGHLAYWQTDYEATTRHYERALELFREGGDRLGEVEALIDLGYVAFARSDTAAGLSFVEEGRSLADELGSRRWASDATSVIGLARFIQGDTEGAISAYREAREGFQAVGNQLLAAEMLGRIGGTYRQIGDLDSAERHFREAILESGAIAATGAVMVFIEELAAVASSRGEHERALRLGGAAARVGETLEARPPAAFLRLPDVRAEARESLDEAAIDRLWDEGREMTAEQAVAYALEGLGPDTSKNSV